MLKPVDKKRANRPVRVEDVARVAGVSPITVSRALSNPEKVREETRRRVAAAVAETGYVVNSFASSLRSGRSSIVTVFVSSLMNPHFARTIQGIVDALEGSRYHLMFAQAGYSEQLELDVVNSVLPFRPAGVVFTGVVRAEHTRNALQQLAIPVMEMWGHRPDPIDMLVGLSHFEGGRLMGTHFGRQGYRCIAYSGHATERGAERLAGFRAGLEAGGAELALVHAMEGTRGLADGIAAFDAIRHQQPGCDAIFFGSDVLASGAIVRCLDLGIAIPGEIAIAGYGDLDFTPHVRPTLTSIHVPAYEMGLEAGRMLLRRLNGQAPGPAMLLPVRLEARASTGA